VRFPIVLLLGLCLVGCEPVEVRDDAQQLCQDLLDCGPYAGSGFSSYDECVEEVLGAVDGGGLDPDDCDSACAGIVRCAPEGTSGFVWEI
jgi:hypothetical protein